MDHQKNTEQSQEDVMPLPATQVPQPVAATEDRVAEFERLLAAALHRILTESAPEAKIKSSPPSLPGRHAGANGGQP